MCWNRSGIVPGCSRLPICIPRCDMMQAVRWRIARLGGRNRSLHIQTTGTIHTKNNSQSSIESPIWIMRFDRGVKLHHPVGIPTNLRRALSSTLIILDRGIAVTEAILSAPSTLPTNLTGALPPAHELESEFVHSLIPGALFLVLV
jgi:hypothetical protein